MKSPMYIKRDFVSLSATNNNFGVDKLLVFTDCFEIADIKPWNYAPNTKQAGEQEIEHKHLVNIAGEPITGAKLYINKPGYSAEIKHNQMYVQFNPSKYFHPSDLVSDPNKIAEVINSIQVDMKETMQTDISLQNSGISRIDITAQAEMDKPVPTYDSIISGAKQLKRAPKTEYPNGFLIGNGQRKICTYDKGLKLQLDSGIKTTDPTNFLRIEPRFLNARAVKDHTAFRTVNDLLNADIDKLKWSYSKTFADLLQIDQTQMHFVELTALTNLIETVQTTHKRQWLQFLLLVLSQGNSSLPSVTQFEQALIPLVHADKISRSTQWRAVKDYQKIIHQTRLINSAYQKQSETNYAEQHQEFMNKFINPYKVA